MRTRANKREQFFKQQLLCCGISVCFAKKGQLSVTKSHVRCSLPRVCLKMWNQKSWDGCPFYMPQTLNASSLKNKNVKCKQLSFSKNKTQGSVRRKLAALHCDRWRSCSTLE